MKPLQMEQPERQAEELKSSSLPEGDGQDKPDAQSLAAAATSDVPEQLLEQERYPDQKQEQPHQLQPQAVVEEKPWQQSTMRCPEGGAPHERPLTSASLDLLANKHDTAHQPHDSCPAGQVQQLAETDVFSTSAVVPAEQLEVGAEQQEVGVEQQEVGVEQQDGQQAQVEQPQQEAEEQQAQQEEERQQQQQQQKEWEEHPQERNEEEQWVEEQQRMDDGTFSSSREYPSVGSGTVDNLINESVSGRMLNSSGVDLLGAETNGGSC
jgi:hypothetical protein